MPDSFGIIKDNFLRLQTKYGLQSYAELGNLLGVNENTIKTWYSSRGSAPSLSKLDAICDKLNICTEDLFRPASIFDTQYSQNDTRRNAITNIKTFLIMNKLFNKVEAAKHIGVSYSALVSYLRENDGREIPLSKLDLFAMKLNTTTYDLVRRK